MHLPRRYDRFHATGNRERKLQAIGSHLHAVLASSASNEAISEELSDMVGYDDMDMIVEILENRSLVAVKVRPTLRSARIYLLIY